MQSAYKALREMINTNPLGLTSVKDSKLIKAADSYLPYWVEYLIEKLNNNPKDYKRIKVFFDNDHPITPRWIVIDGNHRLLALKSVLSHSTKIDVLILSYSTNR